MGAMDTGAVRVHMIPTKPHFLSGNEGICYDKILPYYKFLLKGARVEDISSLKNIIAILELQKIQLLKTSGFGLLILRINSIYQ